MPTPRVPDQIGLDKFPSFRNYDSAIVAKAGGVQATATQLAAQVNIVGTVASAADAVRLPKILAQQSGILSSAGAGLGTPVIVFNSGANAMQVFGATPDTINGVATATGVSMVPGSGAMFVSGTFTQSTKVGTWFAMGGSGFGPNQNVSGLLQLSGIEDNITAHAGGTQGAAFPLSATKSIHNVTIVGSAADSVVLPAATGSGTVHWVKNSAAANSLQLFGLGTDTIDGVASGTGVAVAAGKTRIVLDDAAGKWISILGA